MRKKSKGILAIVGVLLVSVLMVVSCLNPIGFNPELKMSTESTVSGEIGIDNINSAELRFVNHTRSMDIDDIEIIMDWNADEVKQAYSTGDSRISGGPSASAYESILQRPTYANAVYSTGVPVKVNGYKIYIFYRPSSDPKFPKLTEQEKKDYLDSLKAKGQLVEGKFIGEIGSFSRQYTPGAAWGAITDPTIVHLADNLLRGKQILHFFRDKNGYIQISTSNPNVDDVDNADFTQSVEIVNGNTSIGNINNIDVSIKDLPKLDVEVTYSSEFMAAITGAFTDLGIKLDDIKNALLAMNSSLGLINNSMISLGDYINAGNQLLLRIAEGLENSDKFKETYGSLTVWNNLSTPVDEVYFLGSNGLKYFSIENVSPSGTKGPSINNISTNVYVYAGNYTIGIVANGYDTVITNFVVEKYGSNFKSTRLRITEGSKPQETEYIYLTKNTTPPEPKADYTLTPNGVASTGPGTGTTTTQIALHFNKIPTQAFMASMMQNVIGAGIISVVGSGQDFVINVDVKASTINSTQTFEMTINNSTIEDYLHSCPVYLKDDTQPPRTLVNTTYEFKQAGIDSVVTSGNGSSTTLSEVPYNRKDDHQFDWWLDYDIIEHYSDGSKVTVQTVHKVRPGAFKVDGSNNGSYITHTTSGRLYIRDYTSGTYIAGDKPTATSWLFHAAIDWGQTMDGHTILNMPYMTVPLYLGPIQIGSTKVYGLDINVRVTN